MAFEFIDTAAPPEEDRPLSSLAKLTPRKLASSILEVYQRLGGTKWLLEQAQADPKAFFELLKKILPTNIKIDGLEGLSISLVQAFVEKPDTLQLGNADVIDLEDRRKGMALITVDAQDPKEYKKLAEYESAVETATGGNLASSLDAAEQSPPTQDERGSALPSGVVLTERFDEPRIEDVEDSASDETATSGNLNFNFR